jgi:hypothetical protein
MIKLERTSSFRIDIVNSLLQIEESMTARSRDRSSNAKNRRNQKTIKRQQDFETFINREFSRFEYVKAKTIVLHKEDVASKITNVLRRADSASERERERRRKRERERESSVAAEQRKILISAVEEERKRERRRERSRERERRDRKQAASK